MSSIFKNIMANIKIKLAMACFSGSVDEYIAYKEKLEKKYKK